MREIPTCDCTLYEVWYIKEGCQATRPVTREAFTDQQCLHRTENSIRNRLDLFDAPFMKNYMICLFLDCTANEIAWGKHYLDTF